MEEGVATIIIEPRSLVREALMSLMASYSYQTICSFASPADIDNSLLAANAPELVILGALPPTEATATASDIRKLWPESKIVLLFEHASPADLDKLLVSEIDGCIPLSASPPTFIGALQQIIARDLRILVHGSGTYSSTPTTAWQEDGLKPNSVTNNMPRRERPEEGAASRVLSIRLPHGLTEREEQILKGLVKGHSNKMIARTCAASEATVKIHVKSILRKIRVANRTQAAVWALEQGYRADDARHQAINDTPSHGRLDTNLSGVVGVASN